MWTGFRHLNILPVRASRPNHAERALRGAVIYRKLSLGSQSETGERYSELRLSTPTSTTPQAPTPAATLRHCSSRPICVTTVPSLSSSVEAAGGPRAIRESFTNERVLLFAGANLCGARRRCLKGPRRLLADLLAMCELALIVAHGFDRFRVGVDQAFGDLLGLRAS
jgi:hypothetical protein